MTEYDLMKEALERRCERAILAAGWTRGSHGKWCHPAAPSYTATRARYVCEDWHIAP